MTHGGKREGAGRKKKDRSEQDFYPDAESYLSAVVRGETPPDAARIMAAKTLIAYQKAKARAPVASLAPEKLRLKTDRDIEESAAAEYAAKVAKILKKYGRLK